METLPIPHTSLAAMVGSYRQAEEKILAAFKLLREAEAGCQEAFQAHPYDFRAAVEYHSKHIDLDKPMELMFQWKKCAWRRLVDKMGIRKMMSIARAKQLDEQLESGKDLPEITEANILAMAETTMNTYPQMVQEAVKEVYAALRPRSQWGKNYKTNDEFKVGRRVILSNRIKRGWSGTTWEVSYHYHAELTALDNVFHMLAGKGIPPGHDGPLITAIKTATPEGRGQTDYFRFTLYAGNGNLHLEFLKLDLVDELNRVAGGGALRRPKQEAQNNSTALTTI